MVLVGVEKMVAYSQKEWALVALVIFLGIIIGGVVTFYVTSMLPTTTAGGS